MPVEIDPQMKSIGKGILQINLRLSRILEAVETGSGGHGDPATLDVLLDLLDAITLATRGPRLPVRRRWWQFLAPPQPGPDERLAGIALAREHALSRLASMGIEPIDTTGPFDPALHQAVERRHTANKALQGMIAATHRPGWVRVRGGSRTVLRSTQVTVYTLQED